MDEVWARAGLILGALSVAAAITLVLRGRTKRSPRAVDPAGLAPGVYLFTSHTCADCRPARRMLTDVLGEGGFTEMNWEREPGTFNEVGIDAVPATLVVDGEGRATLYPGLPGKALARLGP